MTGRELYLRWLAASHDCSLERAGQLDAAGYYDAMNPADRQGWQRLAHELAADACRAIGQLDNAHHAYTHAALRGGANVDSKRSELIAARESVREQFGCS